MRTPLEQFKVAEIVRLRTDWIDWTITNNTIYLIIGIIIVGVQIRRGIIYKRIEEIGREAIPKDYGRYVPLIIGVFSIVTISNIIGLIPYSTTITAQIAMTVTMSLTIMIGVTIIGIKKHKGRFIRLFIPAGIDKGGIRVIIPLIFGIEVISYLIRVISLAVRLTANVMSGHTLMKIVAEYGLKYSLYPTTAIKYGVILIPVIVLTGVYALEIGVALIQGYVFTLLMSTYIKDVENLH